MVEINNTFQKDSLGLEKPLTKAVEKFGSAAGIIYGDVFKMAHRGIVKKAKAEAEARVIEANSKEEVKNIEMMGVISRLEKYDYLCRSKNLENVFNKAKPYFIDAIVNDEPLDEDWTRRLISVSEDTSDEAVQETIAKIFAEEIQQPGNHSKRLLDYLRSSSKKELELFIKFATLSSDIGLYHMGNAVQPGSLKKYGLTSYDLICLADYGLIRFARDLGSHLDLGLSVVPASILFMKTRSKVTISSDNKRHLELGIYPLTEIGKELYNVLSDRCDYKVQEQYINDFMNYLVKNELNVNKECF